MEDQLASGQVYLVLWENKDILKGVYLGRKESKNPYNPPLL